MSSHSLWILRQICLYHADRLVLCRLQLCLSWNQNTRKNCSCLTIISLIRDCKGSFCLTLPHMILRYDVTDCDCSRILTQTYIQKPTILCRAVSQGYLHLTAFYEKLLPLIVRSCQTIKQLKSLLYSIVYMYIGHVGFRCSQLSQYFLFIHPHYYFHDL